MLITPIEIFRLAFMTLALGYIFSGFVMSSRNMLGSKIFDWNSLKTAMLIAGPAVILHELGHKFTALFFHLPTEFFASYFGLGIGLVLRIIGSPIIMFIPGYVSISNATVIQSTIIAAMGPAMNLLLWIAASLLLTYKTFDYKTSLILFATKRINMILFIFNMIPLPPLDGSKVLFGLLHLF